MSTRPPSTRTSRLVGSGPSALALARVLCASCPLHSFATLLNELQVTDRAAQGVMGWSNASQAKRYQKMNDPVLRVIADKVEGALWGK